MRTDWLKLGFSIVKGKLISDHRYALICEPHQQEADTNHLSQCAHFRLDFQVFRLIERTINRGNILSSENEIRIVNRMLGNISERLIVGLACQVLKKHKKSDCNKVNGLGYVPNRPRQ